MRSATKNYQKTCCASKISMFGVFFQAAVGPGQHGVVVYMAKRSHSRQEFDQNENSGPSARLVGSSQQSLDDDEQHKIGSSPAVMESIPLLSFASVRFYLLCIPRDGQVLRGA
jgi:hypothetical protein